MRTVLLLSLTILFSFCNVCLSQITGGPYLGQTPPGSIPEIFAPGVVSINGRGEERITFSPQGDEIFFGVHSMDYQNHRIMRIVRKGEHWPEPDSVEFLGGGNVGSPVFSPEGDRLFFKSWNLNISFIERLNDGWSPPTRLDKIIKINENFGPASGTTDGTLYFNLHSGSGFDYESHKNNKILFSKLINDKYTEPQPLPDNINNGSFAVYDPIVAPDESYLIFTASFLGGSGGGDLFISFKKDDGSWTDPKNLGDKINSDNWEYAPAISSDRKYLFFTRWGPACQPDIYWVKFDSMVIKNLKQLMIYKSGVYIEPPYDGEGYYFNNHMGWDVHKNRNDKKQDIENAIKESLNRGLPVLVQSPFPEWGVIVGYNDDKYIINSYDGKIVESDKVEGFYILEKTSDIELAESVRKSFRVITEYAFRKRMPGTHEKWYRNYFCGISAYKKWISHVKRNKVRDKYANWLNHGTLLDARRAALDYLIQAKQFYSGASLNQLEELIEKFKEIVNYLHQNLSYFPKSEDLKDLIEGAAATLKVVSEKEKEAFTFMKGSTLSNS